MRRGKPVSHAKSRKRREAESLARSVRRSGGLAVGPSGGAVATRRETLHGPGSE